ncbi:hypothetical protein BXZ70DRAFT_186037 [Cristinia sonorae]|uniref:DUF6593 domain-containing protein n=1 Tax=Cristinia sonorae TaxID=1940300 RepID=A0A8K0XPV3_9AGAR|nr:hypothetical protein BXZ70DRAFT_186037 [Cristinia sonorae]
MELYLSLNSSTSTILSAISAEPFTPPEPIESTTIQHRDRQFEAATPLYHIYTPGVLTRETTTISRISPAVAHDAAYQFKSNKSSDLKECTEYEGGGVEEIARIHWRMASASKLVYQGKVLYINKFMPAGGFLWLKRTFTGPDGLSYSWHLGTLTTHL